MSAYIRIGYVLSTYPVFEQPFISREVRELRRHGLDVRTFSLRTPEDAQVKSLAEREERSTTFYLRQSGMAFIARAHCRFLFSAPMKFLAVLVYALRLSSGGLRSLLWQCFYFMEAVCLVEWARMNQIEHVHVHIAQSACSVALIAAKSGKLTFSLTEHGPYVFDNCDSLYLSDKFAEARTVVCISDYCRSQVMRQVPPRHWNKLHVVRQGVDVKCFSRNRTRPMRRERVSILCVGRLTPTKGQRLLVQACAELRRKGISFQCVIVGAGPDSEPVRQMVADLGLKDCVQLAGGVGEDDVRRFCESADIFVLATLAEGLPTVLMEAMAMKLPVVSTDVMGIPELVDDGVNGLLVRPGRVDELAEALDRLARDPALRTRLAHAGREEVERHYRLEANVASLAQVLRGCISKP